MRIPLILYTSMFLDIYSYFNFQNKLSGHIWSIFGDIIRKKGIAPLNTNAFGRRQVQWMDNNW